MTLLRALPREIMSQILDLRGISVIKLWCTGDSGLQAKLASSAHAIDMVETREFFVGALPRALIHLRHVRSFNIDRGGFLLSDNDRTYEIFASLPGTVRYMSLQFANAAMLFKDAKSPPCDYIPKTTMIRKTSGIIDMSMQFPLLHYLKIESTIVDLPKMPLSLASLLLTIPKMSNFAGFLVEQMIVSLPQTLVNLKLCNVGGREHCFAFLPPTLDYLEIWSDSDFNQSLLQQNLHHLPAGLTRLMLNYAGRHPVFRVKHIMGHFNKLQDAAMVMDCQDEDDLSFIAGSQLIHGLFQFTMRPSKLLSVLPKHLLVLGLFNFGDQNETVDLSCYTQLLQLHLHDITPSAYPPSSLRELYITRSNADQMTRALLPDTLKKLDMNLPIAYSDATVRLPSMLEELKIKGFGLACNKSKDNESPCYELLPSSLKSLHFNTDSGIYLDSLAAALPADLKYLRVCNVMSHTINGIRNLPHSLETLEIGTLRNTTLSAQDVGEIPTKLRHLRLFDNLILQRDALRSLPMGLETADLQVLSHQSELPIDAQILSSLPASLHVLQIKPYSYPTSHSCDDWYQSEYMVPLLASARINCHIRVASPHDFLFKTLTDNYLVSKRNKMVECFASLAPRDLHPQMFNCDFLTVEPLRFTPSKLFEF